MQAVGRGNSTKQWRIDLKVENIIDYCVKIYEDMQLNYVREWKAKTGGLAVGYLPVWVPKEIFYAANVLPVGLMGGGEMVDVMHGDSYYQSYICHMPRSVLEMEEKGMLEPLVGLVCPSVCDTVRNMVGIWNILFPKKYTHYFDIPQNFNPSIGGKWLQHEMKTMLRGLEACGAHVPTTEELNRSIKLYNENRRLIRILDQIRSDKPWIVPSHEFYLLIRSGNVIDVKEHNRMLSDYIDGVSVLDRKPEDKIRVAVIGGFCEQPPLGLVKTIEMAGCYVVADDYVIGNRFITEDIDDLSSDPLKAISDAFLYHSEFSSSKYEVPNPKPPQLVKLVRERKGDGVILAGPSFCDPILLDVPGYVNALDREGIPYIQFVFAEDNSQFRAIEEDVGAFSDSIRLWRN